MSGLEFRIFAPFAYFGGAIWVTFFLSLGYWFGENWQAIIVLTHRYTLPAVLLCCGVAGILWLVANQRNRRRLSRGRPAQQSEPRD
jgi:membrane protein DedA with SNARE-associated domain